MANKIQMTLFDVPSIRTSTQPVSTKKKIERVSIDISNTGLVAITEGRCKKYKTLAESFGNKL